MDRNLYYGDGLTFADGSLSARRAWIEIGVGLYLVTEKDMSLSARRAWIEMTTYLETSSIDESLSARRAWIEIFIEPLIFSVQPVALRKESVDRNVIGDVMGKALAGRSPQGERG